MPTPASLRASASRSFGSCIGVDMAGPAMRPESVPVSVSPPFADCVVGVSVCGLRRFRHVFRLDQPLDDLKRAVAPDGGDAAGDHEIIRLEPGAGLDLGLDSVEARLDAFGLLDQRLGPRVVVRVGELVVAGAELLDLSLLGVGRLGGLGMDAPEARGGAPVDVRHRLGPLPAGRELVGGRLEPLHGELDEQRRVLQPDAVLVLVGEEVAQHRAARGLVGVDATKRAIGEPAGTRSSVSMRFTCQADGR